eukprot:scaffold2193_cov179-Ochromonas_danica.AAC.44
MMNNIVLSAPIQWISFQQENVAPPNAIRVEDLGQIETLKTRKRQAKAYCKTVKRLKVDEDTVTVHDVAAAEDFEDGARVSDRFNQTILRLDAIDQGLNGIDNHFNDQNYPTVGSVWVPKSTLHEEEAAATHTEEKRLSNIRSTDYNWPL